jgi:hypothetical protein
MSLNLSTVGEFYFSRLFELTKLPVTGPSRGPNSHPSSDLSLSKGRVLLVDKHTTPVISMSYTQSQLLENDVILIELIEGLAALDHMKNLRCIVYIKPTEESINYFINELRAPHYHDYQVFFNNTVSKSQLEALAQADEFESVSNITELFNDFLTVNDNLFTLNELTSSSSAIAPPPRISSIDESNEIISLLLSLKQCPIIKFESNSIDVRKLASEILYNINSNSNNNLFDDTNISYDKPPVLLLLDRANDPITPLLTPWTYQSMVHEFIGIVKNTVQVPSSSEQYIISKAQDKFFAESMYLNYGDLTENFQKNVEQYKAQAKMSSLDSLNTQNLSELKKQLTKFPEFKRLNSNIAKHLSIISEIDKQISQQQLWDVGELQQTIVGGLENYQSIKEKLLQIIDNILISTVHKLKLILLFQSRFHQHNDLPLLSKKINDPASNNPLPTVSQNTLLKRFNIMFKAKVKTNTSQNPSKNLTNLFNKNISINSLFNHHDDQRNDNIYMQYSPYLNEILDNLINPRESTSSGLTTLIPENLSKQYGKNIQSEVQNVIIYIKGGVTYEEARLVHELNDSNKSLNLIIGGSRIHNSESWLESMYDMINDSSSLGQTTTTIDRKAGLRELL